MVLPERIELATQTIKLLFSLKLLNRSMLHVYQPRVFMTSSI